jgi:hypothetical protein
MLMAFVVDDTRDLLPRVIAVQMIREVVAKELMDSITAYIPKASTEIVDLGMDIMDPRIGTRFPQSLKDALEKLVADWK